MVLTQLKQMGVQQLPDLREQSTAGPSYGGHMPPPPPPCTGSQPPCAANTPQQWLARQALPREATHCKRSQRNQHPPSFATGR
eukprot:6468523-Amphidinium_carterae.1